MGCKAYVYFHNFIEMLLFMNKQVSLMLLLKSTKIEWSYRIYKNKNMHVTTQKNISKNIYF